MIRVVNVDVGYFLFGCIFRLNFFHHLVLSTMGPLVVLPVLGCAYVQRKMNINLCENALRVVRHRLISAAIFVIAFAYASATFTILQTFSCDRLDNGIAYLRADYSLTCSTPLHKVYQAYAGVMMGVYAIAIPGLMFWWLLRNRKDLQSEHRQSMPHLRPFRQIWMAYTPSRYYYEVIECARRIFYAGSAILGMGGRRMQLIVGLPFSVVLEVINPFENAFDVALYRWGTGIILGSTFVALLAGDEHLADGSDNLILVLSDALLFANLVMAATVFVIGVRDVIKPRESGNPTILDVPVRNTLYTV
ncbi:MAG: hypothetical protein ABJO88_02695 [Parasphingorhabdus sp.]